MEKVIKKLTDAFSKINIMQYLKRDVVNKNYNYSGTRTMGNCKSEKSPIKICLSLRKEIVCFI